MSKFSNILKAVAAVTAALLLSACSKEDVRQEQDNSNQNTNITGFVTQNEALDLASQFIKRNNEMRSASDQELKVVYTDASKMRSTTGQDQPSYYVINVGDNGYVIVSASDATFPILGYSNESAFNPQDIPVNMLGVLDGYSKEVQYAWKNLKADEKTKEMRSAAIAGNYKAMRASSSVEPLLGSIKWNQTKYYSALCPKTSNGVLCPVGCVAIATAQIMRYWEYPSEGQGKHSYKSTYGTLSHDYNYALEWSKMPKPELKTNNSMIAKFCYGVAVALDMHFGPKGSGTYQSLVPDVLKTYYKYPDNVKNLNRSDYKAEQWATLVRNELKAKRPVQYAGSGKAGGHSFVCDGYNEEGYFHFNWGWGGSSDGYFLLNALNPGSLGIGGGAGGFNNYQQIVVNFAPPSDAPDVEPTPEPEPEPDPAPTTYCTSSARNSYYTYINGVSMGYMKNVTGGNKYANYTNKEVVAKAGYSFKYYLYPGFASTKKYWNYWKVWIDYNNNGIFESNEMVIEKYDYASVSGWVELPSNIKPGTYRIRVSMKNGAYPEPCETFNYGEVEDYTLRIAK